MSRRAPSRGEISSLSGEEDDGWEGWTEGVTMGSVSLHRVYDDEDGGPAGGARYLVERLWPRGVRKESLTMDGWLKDVAPSTELRRWFGHDPQKWAEFRRRYTAELDANPQAWAPLVQAAASKGGVTLLYSSRDTEHNNAVALRDYLLEHAVGRA